MGLLQRVAPGCLDQCKSRHICHALNHAISAYGPKDKKDEKAAEHAVCSHQGAFACLLQKSHRNLCHPLISQAGRFGIPTETGALYGRCSHALQARVEFEPGATEEAHLAEDADEEVFSLAGQSYLTPAAVSASEVGFISPNNSNGTKESHMIHEANMSMDKMVSLGEVTKFGYIRHAYWNCYVPGAHSADGLVGTSVGLDFCVHMCNIADDCSGIVYMRSMQSPSKCWVRSRGYRCSYSIGDEAAKFDFYQKPPRYIEHLRTHCYGWNYRPNPFGVRSLTECQNACSDDLTCMAVHFQRSQLRCWKQEIGVKGISCGPDKSGTVDVYAKEKFGMLP